MNGESYSSRRPGHEKAVDGRLRTYIYDVVWYGTGFFLGGASLGEVYRYFVEQVMKAKLEQAWY